MAILKNEAKEPQKVKVKARSRVKTELTSFGK